MQQGMSSSGSPNTIVQKASAEILVSEGRNSGLGYHHYRSWVRYSAGLLLFICGIFSNYASKIENRTIVARCGDETNPDCAPKAFAGVGFQTWWMFGSEFLALAIFYVDKFYNKRQGKYPYTEFRKESEVGILKAKGPFWIWFIPACCDFGASVLSNMSSQLIYTSTKSMLANTMAVITALLQLLVIRRALRIHEVLGVLGMTTAMVLTAIPAVLQPDVNSSNKDYAAWYGILFYLLATVLWSLQFIIEEVFFKRWNFSPFQAVGLEGMCGFVISSAALPIFHVSGFENVKASFYQFGHSPKVIGVFFLYTVATIGFNAFGQMTTKLSSALFRLTISEMRAPTSWLIDLGLGWIKYNNYAMVALFVYIVAFSTYARLWFPAKKVPRAYLKISKALHIPHWTKPEKDEDHSWVYEIIAEKEARKNGVVSHVNDGASPLPTQEP
eukprot:Blabericola_migrator_1__1654@NODE_1444_length_4533_cov_193_547918_g626_i1_p2_GENE_NODE_1444_length_4533_cov_193_547918_g626_i1NODE_1444_length_4533_cov_193_547918_g626_i1_p2_ORF_typecomplete_len442_score71_57SLC35F/PF06027_12/1_6e25CRTlike/PF08627_10/1_8e20CRTlike/PF08627_10/8_6e02UAA/PF08449_11/3_2e15Nuc_sug_transp/PF04142_15/8_2e15PUNUT/PF16913_5/1_2e09TPT/PF03151_16/1_4e08TPT/PF03151_16/8_3e03EamA/PF00892_20/1_2e04EamA/PF00892_20/0_00074EamA/PF00892_20/0_076EamA/PF00892_20/6_8e03Rab5ip/PF0701